MDTNGLDHENDRKIGQIVDVIGIIESRFDRMSKSHKKIATYICEHYDQAVFMTAAQLGKEVDISESTVVRFASGLGFEGYPEFQDALELWVKNAWNGVTKINLKYGRSTQSEVLTGVFNSDIEKMADTLENMDPDAFEAAVNMIWNAKKVYIVGIRSSEPLADFLGLYLSMIRDDVVLVRSTNVTEIFEQMIRVNEDDCVIGISFPRYSMRTLKAMEFANNRNAKVVTITDNIHSPMKLYSTCNLCARSDMISIVDSLVAPLSLINALVVALCLKDPERIEKNLRTLEQTWNDYQVYMNDEINYITDDPHLKDPFNKTI